VNKKDCENIGLILASINVPAFICEEFFRLDNRIEGEYEAFAIRERRQDAIYERMEDILKAKFGGNYCILKACDKEQYRIAREQATREVYQDGEE